MKAIWKPDVMEFDGERLHSMYVGMLQNSAWKDVCKKVIIDGESCIQARDVADESLWQWNAGHGFKMLEAGNGK